MKQPKYAARFLNFFLSLRLNRAEFADMAGYTLAALQKAPAAAGYQPLVDALGAALADYRAVHSGQLSGEAKGATLTLAQALADFKAYVKKVERKIIIPTYDAGSPDVLALLPQGRSGLVGSNQAEVQDAFTAFLAALDARASVFPKPLRDEGRGVVLKNLVNFLGAADQARQAAGTRTVDLHDGRAATCALLYKTYATLLLQFYESPKQAAAFFDLSKAAVSGIKAAPKPPVLPQ